MVRERARRLENGPDIIAKALLACSFWNKLRVVLRALGEGAADSLRGGLDVPKFIEKMELSDRAAIFGCIYRIYLQVFGGQKENFSRSMRLMRLK